MGTDAWWMHGVAGVQSESLGSGRDEVFRAMWLVLLGAIALVAACLLAGGVYRRAALFLPRLFAVVLFAATWRYMPLGIAAKLSVLLSHPIEHLEKNRAAFYFQGSDERYGLEDALRLMHEDETTLSPCLVVGFAGGAMQLMSVPRHEFVRGVGEVCECDRLFLMDPDQSWYFNDPERGWNGLSFHRELLCTFTERYEHVMFVGNCLGAVGVCLFAEYCDYALAFNPQTDPMNDPRRKYRIGAARVPRAIRENILRLLNEGIRACTGTVEVHVTAEIPAEVRSAALLDASIPSLAVKHHYFDGRESGTNLPGALKKRDLLYPLIRRAYEAMILRPSARKLLQTR